MGTIREACRVVGAHKKYRPNKTHDFLKLRGFFNATIDLSLIIHVGEKQSNSVEEQIDSTSIDNFYSWKPSHLLTKSDDDSNSKKDQQEFFNHVTNYASQ